MSMLKVWSEDDCLYLDYEDEDEFFLIPEASKLPVPTSTTQRRPNPRASLTSQDLNERVIVFGEKRGILRYIGPTHFESGEWCGIELDLPDGKNDGRVQDTDYFHCLPNHGLFVPSHCVELLKSQKPKRFSLCLRDIESGSSTSSSLAENETLNSNSEEAYEEELENSRSYLQFKARHRKKLNVEMKPSTIKGQRPQTAMTTNAVIMAASAGGTAKNKSISNRSLNTRIPVLESKVSSINSANHQSFSSSRHHRKRHVAGQPATSSISALPDSKNRIEIKAIYDTKTTSKAVLNPPNPAAKSGESEEMDSSFGILSPSDMNAEESWTMIRSRTFTRELNDPQAENDLIVEDLDFKKTEEKSKKSVKKFKLNIVEEHHQSDTNKLMNRTEELLKSKKSFDAAKAQLPLGGQQAVVVKSKQTMTQQDFPDVAESLKFRTESLLHSKTRRKKKKTKAEHHKKLVVENTTDSGSGSSWSNIPRCFNVTTSMLSSDAGISSMPSSMISNISESEHEVAIKHVVEQVEIEDHEELVITENHPDVIKARARSQEKGTASKRAELLAETRIVPNTNVGSKLKEILAEKVPPNSKRTKDKPKGKWDDIMSQIAQGQKLKKLAVDKKEVRSKVFADFKPPKLIRPSADGSKQKIYIAASSRSNSTLSSKSSNTAAAAEKRLSRQSSSLVSRSTSTASVASQIIIKENDLEEDDIEDDVSECTLKDYAKKSVRKSNADFVKNNAAAVSRKNSTASRKSSSAGGGSKSSVVSGGTNKKAASEQVNYLRSNNNSSHHHQPDLVKVSSPKLSDLARLEHVLDEKNRENDQLRIRLKHNAKGFEALALTVDHFASKLADLDNLKLYKKLDDLHLQVQSKEAEIELLQRQLLSNESQVVESEDSSCSAIAEKDAIIEHLENRLRLCEEENESFIAKLKNDHKSELDLLAESHKIDFKSFENEQENYLKDHEARHSDILHEVEEKWKQKLAMQLEEKNEELQKIAADFERQSEKWAEAKRNLEDQLHSVQTELRNQEMAVSAKQKGDLLMKSTQNKLTKVMAEVDSLKAVLEMKTEEIHALRLEKAKLEDKLEDFDRMKVAHGKVSAQMEDLKAQLNEKQVVERKLSEENRQLYNNMEREMNAKRRLTMEKEELEWKMRSFTADQGPMSMSMMEGYTGSPFDSFMASTPMALQTKGALTASYSEHCPQSLPPFTGRSRKSRPVSAPPGKFDMASLCKSLKDQTGPDSPRLCEVVEKNESLSWKIEYQEGSDQEICSSAGASPLLAKRSSTMTRSLERPSSSSTKRRSESPNAASGLSRSLSRSNSSRKKIIPSFEPLSESTESDSLEEQLLKDDEKEPSKIAPSVNISDDLDDDIGDISSSSEIEIDEPLAEVTTPQIEALMFPSGPSTSTTSSEAAMSSPDAEVTIRSDLTKQLEQKPPALSSSMPNYDLNKLFSGVQDSGGEGMMAFTPTEDEMIMSGTSDSIKPGSEMADSTVSMTSWSTEDFSASSA